MKSWTIAFDRINSAIDDINVINDFFKEGEATEEEVDNQYNNCLELIEDLEVRNMLQKEEDQLGAILKINPGAGGTESNDCLLYTSPSPRDRTRSRMPSSA